MVAGEPVDRIRAVVGGRCGKVFRPGEVQRWVSLSLGAVSTFYRRKREKREGCFDLRLVQSRVTFELGREGGCKPEGLDQPGREE